MFGFYRIAACVPVVRVADPAFNAEQILSLAKKAAADRASVQLFPELALSAYSCGDLFHNGTLLDGVEQAAERLCRETADLDSILAVGAPVRYRNRLFNAALILQHGKILGIVPKTHLPNYREFYEKRYFSSGYGIRNTTVDFAGQTGIPFGTDLLFDAGGDLRIGAEICEDMWSTVPPSSLQSLASATLLLNLSASNELVGKADYRRSLVQGLSARCVAVYAYASAGVHESTTDIVCGGHCIVAENGAVLLDSERFQRENVFYTADVDLARVSAARLGDSPFADSAATTAFPEFTLVKAVQPPVPELAQIRRTYDRKPFVPASDEQRKTRCREIFAIQTAGLAKRVEHTHAKKLVIGISGGLDSTLALLVCVRTMELLQRPASDIIAITMPGFGTTDRTYHNAVNLCKALGAELREISIAEACREHFRSIGHDEKVHDVTYENSQARERTQILMDVANSENALVVGTGDLSEIAMGWCTYNGDHISMYAVNCSIPKTLIRYLVAFVADESEKTVRDLLYDVIDTPVSPELLPADEAGRIRQKTEDIIGPYEVHDFYLYHFFKYGAGPEKLLFLAKRAFGDLPEAKLKDYLNTFLRRFFTQQFKRSCSTDGPKVGTVSLSPRGDWRMPSDASFDLWKSLLG
ncbi:MAG: NAD(+) synthase [Lentisphaerae bacterium]|nr:NAD(+) synthase [Lentisphaerota bacterium]